MLSCCNNSRKNNDFSWVDTKGIKDGMLEMNIPPTLPSIVKIKDQNLVDFLLLSSIADSVSMVGLATNRNGIIGSIDKMVIANGSFYILDRRKSSKVYCFAADGVYISTIGTHGHGEGEYHEPTDFDIVGDTVVILDQFKTCLHYYSSNGRYITSKRLPFYTTGLSIMNDTTYLFNTIYADNEHLGDIVNYSLIMTDSTMSIKKYGFYREHGKYSSIWGPENFYRAVHHTVFHPALSDMVYSINTAGDIERKYKIDFGNRALPEKLTFNSKWDEFKQESVQKEYFIFPGKSFETNNYLFIEYLDNHESRYTIYDKKNKIVKNARYIKNDLETGLAIESIVGFSNNILIGMVTPAMLIQIYNDMPQTNMKETFSAKALDILENLSEEDNPILIMIHLK